MNWWLSVKSEATKLVAALILGIIAGLTMAWILWIPKTMKTPETPAPAIAQADGSRVIERTAPRPVKPPHMLPPGAVAEREIHVEVQPSRVEPTPIPGSSVTALQPTLSSAPFKLDLTLVRMPDGTRRVVASSPNGEVTAASLDIPAAPPPSEAKVLRWAAGGEFGCTSRGGKSVGVFVDRDFAFVRTGVTVARVTEACVTGWEGRVKLGIRF